MKKKPRRPIRRKLPAGTYCLLEDRRLLAGISLQTVNGFSTVLIDGTAGDDIAEVQNVNSTSIRVTLNSLVETFSTSAVERIRFLGRAGDDSFTNNTEINSAAYGHNGNDTLRGGSGHNWIQGGGGNDTIFGGTRNDHLRGRDGDDFIDPGDRHDRVFGGSGNDTVVASQGNDFISGEAGNDTLHGGDGDDEILGGDGNDNIDGGDGIDILFGDGGDDTLNGRSGDDILRGGPGNDILFGSTGNDQLFGDLGNDAIHGEAGVDQLFGGDGNDSINGGTGNDTLDFGPGNDEFAVFQSEFGDYLVTASGQTISVQSQSATDGNDTIVSAQTLRFSNVDRAVADFQVSLNAAEQVSLQLLNQLRVSHGLSALSVVADLSAFAEHWSRDVLPENFRHSTYNEIEHLFVNGRTYYGENIVFIGNSSLSPTAAAQMFHDAWVDSPSHFSNMIDSRWTEIGVGLVQLPSGWYGTHSFANG